MSEYNRLENGSFVDYESGKSFEFDPVTGKPTAWEEYTVDSHVASTMYVPDTDKGSNVVHPSVNLWELMFRNIILRYQHMQFILLFSPPRTKNRTQSSSSATNITTPTSGVSLSPTLHPVSLFPAYFLLLGTVVGVPSTTTIPEPPL